MREVHCGEKMQNACSLDNLSFTIYPLSDSNNSIWEEEGCQMTPLSCKDHDAYAANSQFITHLMGRILGAQGLQPTPVDTRGFQSVLKLIENTNADSFDLFYGLYKFNRNSGDTIERLRAALEDVVGRLLKRDCMDD